MRILIACEFSGIVRRNFELLGHGAWSCDFLESEQPGNHLQCDVLTILDQGWDLLIAFPPCTYLAASGARWWSEREREQEDAIAFFMKFINAPIKHKAIENPVGVMSNRYQPPDQWVHPWQYGHGETKKTGLWLHNLPPLVPTEVVSEREPVCHYVSPGPERWKDRSRTYSGIARAMAMQWSTYVLKNL